jgi:hypothetical protein
MYSTRYGCQILVKFKFSRQILGKIQKYHCMKVYPVGADLLHTDRRTDGRTEVGTNGRDEDNSRRLYL